MAKVSKRTWTNKDGVKKQCWIIDFTDDNGKRHKKSGFKTKVDAERHLLEILSSVNNGTYKSRNSKITFAEAASNYIELHAEIYCRKTTSDGYKSYLKYHLLPSFGDKLLTNISTTDIQKFIQIKIQEGLTNNSINHILIFMGSVFQKMVNDEVIINNPLKKIKKLKVEPIEMKVLTPKEIQIFLAGAKKHYPDFYPLFFTAVMTGMRQGELMALQWSKINWVTNQIYVDSSYGKGQLTPPKTKHSIRKIDMSKELIKVLREWKLRCPHSDNDLVFPSQAGNYLSASYMYKRKFLPLLRKVGIEKIRFHDLRHTYASLLISQNVPVKYIQKQMGHGSIQVTMDVYGHILPETAQQGINALDSLFKNYEPVKIKAC